VSRTKKDRQFTYTDLDKNIIDNHQIIINTTPLGMSPNTETCPDLPYHFLNDNHVLYDLVYNPAVTLFLEKGEERGSTIKNGLDMLHLQAEKAWDIWQS
jgi:shikimate dehydrogenase